MLFRSSAYSVTVDSSGRFAYVANYFSNNVTAYTIGANGQLTANGAVVAAGNRPSSIAMTYVRP